VTIRTQKLALLHLCRDPLLRVALPHHLRDFSSLGGAGQMVEVHAADVEETAASVAGLGLTLFVPL